MEELLQSYLLRQKLSDNSLNKAKKMKIEEIRKKTNDQLKTELSNLYKETFNLRFQKSSGQLENTSRIFKVRKLIARIKTIMNEKIGN